MTTNRDLIKMAALIHNPKEVVFKDYKRYMLLIAPKYSCHSAIFDHAFIAAEQQGIKYKTVSNNPYTIKFY